MRGLGLSEPVGLVRPVVRRDQGIAVERAAQRDPGARHGGQFCPLFMMLLQYPVASIVSPGMLQSCLHVVQ